MGKSFMEPKITEEVEQYINHFLKPNIGKPFNMSVNLSQATCNVVSQLLYSHRFDYDDYHFNEMIRSMDEIIALNTKIAMVENLPFAKYFLKSLLDREQHLSHTVIEPALQTYIDVRKENLDKDHPSGVIDRYIVYSETEGTGESCFSGWLKILFYVTFY